MVQVLPPKTNLGTSIGQALGQGLQTGLQSALGTQYQRSLLQDALSQVKQTAQSPNASPLDLSLSALQAFAGIPGSEKYVGQVLPLLIQQAQRGQISKEFPLGGIPGAQAAQQPIPRESSAKAINAEGVEQLQTQEVPQEQISVLDILPPKGLIADPTGVAPFIPPYGPDDIAQLRHIARVRGYTPDIEERLVNDAKEYNEVSQARRNAEIQNYQQATQQRADILKNQAAFQDYLTNQAPEFSKNPDEQQLALLASEKYQNEPSFARRLAKVKEEIRPYQQAKSSLKKTLLRPLFGYTEDQLNLARNRAKLMVEKGQKDQLRLMIAQGGQGEVEEALLLNPLDKKLDNDLSKGFPKFTQPLQEVKVPPDSPKFESEFKRAQDRRAVQEKRMVEYLSDRIKPGSYNNPGTNLLLLRKHLTDDLDLDWAESAKVIDEAINKAKIKLDPHQEIDYQKLAYPPLTGEGYLDTILNNIIYKTTGKE